MLSRQIRRKMKRVFKIGLLVLLIVAVIITALVISIRKHYPARIKHAPVRQTVKILRDAYAIPKIEATSNEDALVALGYVHAQERYWQMMLMREAAKGRLAAMFGINQLNHDRIMARLNLTQIAHTSYQQQTELTQKYLKAYAKGINLWAELHEKDRLPKSIEQLFVPVAFTPWQPEDAIILQKYMGFYLSNKTEQSLTSMWMFQHLTEAQREAVLPNIQTPHEQWPTLIKNVEKSSSFNQSGASNIFSVTAKQTQAGASLFAADPHLELVAPSQWYIVSMTWSGQQVTGATIPGIPVILNGRNQYLAWGQTITGLDDQDISLISAKEKESIAGLKTNALEIPIKGHSAYHETIAQTPIGPIFDPVLFGYHLEPAYEWVLQWTGLETRDQSLRFGWDLMSASTIKEALKQRDYLIAPAQNFLVADQSTSRLAMVGHIPKRSAYQPSQGRVPGFYHDQEEHWQGLEPAGDALMFTPGIKGYLINTNNAITTQSFPHNITFNWIDAYRIQRAEHIIRVNHQQTRADFVATQLDTTSIKALWISSLLLYHLNTDAIMLQYRPILKSMQAWQGEMDKERFEPLVYTLWLDYFLKDILSPLGDQWVEVERLNPRFVEQLLKYPEYYHGWCVNDCNDEITNAFNQAMNQLTYQYGDEFAAWQWGRYHHAFHRNPVLDELPIMRWFANIDHPSSGDKETLAMMEAVPFAEKAHRGSGLRTVVDFSEPDQRIHLVISTGQSGHITSRHYSDQNKLWRKGQYIDYAPNLIKVKYKTQLMP